MSLWIWPLAIYLAFLAGATAYQSGRVTRILANQETMMGVVTISEERMDLVRDGLRLQQEQHRFLLTRVKALESAITAREKR